MSAFVTTTEYARLRGVKPNAVSMWKARKQLTAPALREDGMIDVALADEQLRDRLDALKSTGKGTGPQNLFTSPAAPVAPSAADGGSQPENNPALGELNDVRLRRAKLQLREDERRAALACAELVPAAEIAGIWGREIGKWNAAIEQWIPDLVTKLGGGRAEIDVARAEYRKLRERYIAALEQEQDRAA